MKTITTGKKVLALVCFAAMLTAGRAQTGCSSFTGNTMPVLSTSNTAGGINCMLNMRTGSPTGQNNTAFGVRALGVNTAGHNNSAFGLWAAVNTTGGDNAAFGAAALDNNTTGGNNTAIGVLAMTSNGTGNNNTAVGRFANVSTGALSNAMALGYNSSVNTSNKVRVGDANVTTIEGQVNWSWPSDGRFKSDIKEEVKGLEFITKLRPVVYNFETKKFQEFLTKDMPENIRKEYFKESFEESRSIRHSGFIAQEVEKIANEIGYNFDAIHVPKNADDNYSLSYGQFVVPLVKGMQEQQKMIEELQAELKSIKEKQSGATGINENDTFSGFEMGQNIPNPFTNETVIKYTVLPSDVKDAQIFVYDLAGKQIASFRLDKQAGSITITSEKLAAGIYIYTIVADGKAIDSKRMIVAQK